MGVPREKAGEILDRITSSARSVGFLEEIKRKTYVCLQGTASLSADTNGDEAENHQENSRCFSGAPLLFDQQFPLFKAPR